MLRGLQVSKDSGVIAALHRLCGWSLWTKIHNLFVYPALLLLFYACEKYLRGKTWDEMKSLFSFTSPSILAKGWRSLLQGLAGTFYPLVSV